MHEKIRQGFVVFLFSLRMACACFKVPALRVRSLEFVFLGSLILRWSEMVSGIATCLLAGLFVGRRIVRVSMHIRIKMRREPIRRRRHVGMRVSAVLSWRVIPVGHGLPVVLHRRRLVSMIARHLHPIRIRRRVHGVVWAPRIVLMSSVICL